MTTAVALGVMHTVFLQIMMPFHLLIESICFTGFGWLRWISASCFVAEALIIYVIWRGRRSGVQRVGPAAPPSPQHPEPAP